uniref:Uncharacterized protein n=1 Tax=viral metagenome TaxID=1070528 RepID=A0A6C0JVL9_9ZZZZ
MIDELKSRFKEQKVTFFVSIDNKDTNVNFQLYVEEINALVIEFTNLGIKSDHLVIEDTLNYDKLKRICDFIDRANSFEYKVFIGPFNKNKDYGPKFIEKCRMMLNDPDDVVFNEF